METNVTREEVIYSFFAGLMETYAETECPDDVTFPYLTYALTTGSFIDGEQNITVKMWFYTDSEAVANAKAQELSNLIGMGGVVLPYTGGAVWLKRGNPWCSSQNDAEDSNIKLRYINVEAEFLSQD